MRSVVVVFPYSNMLGAMTESILELPYSVNVGYDANVSREIFVNTRGYMLCVRADGGERRFAPWSEACDAW